MMQKKSSSKSSGDVSPGSSIVLTRAAFHPDLLLLRVLPPPPVAPAALGRHQTGARHQARCEAAVNAQLSQGEISSRDLPSRDLLFTAPPPVAACGEVHGS